MIKVILVILNMGTLNDNPVTSVTIFNNVEQCKKSAVAMRPYLIKNHIVACVISKVAPADAKNI